MRSEGGEGAAGGVGGIARWKGRWPICPRPASSIGYVLGVEFGVVQSPTIDNPVIADEWHTRLAAQYCWVYFSIWDVRASMLVTSCTEAVKQTFEAFC